MSNNDGSPRSMGANLKRFFGILKPKSTIHKLGQNPISVNSGFLIDPEVKQILDSSRQAISREASEKELVTESGDSEN